MATQEGGNDGSATEGRGHGGEPGVAAAPRSIAGTRLGPYRIVSSLGGGGMGTVYLAKVETPSGELPPGSQVALKVIHQHLRSLDTFSRRFRREAEIGRQIVHPNVVRTYGPESIDHDGTTVDVIVMEYVEGQTLRALLKETSRVPEELCRHVGLEVTKALGAIHAAGVVHRDVKPENVLVTKDEVVKLMDLGVARLADEALRLSETGSFVGSAFYAAPEQFATGDVPVDGRADLYALGVALYELSTGTHPFADPDMRIYLRRLLTESARPLSEINPQLSPFFEEVVRTLMEKDREARFASAAELAVVLAEGERSLWWRRRASEIRTRTKRPLRRIRVPRDTALHGRDAEMGRLRAAYERAKAGEGRVVLVEGEAGIGKSRLVDEFVERLRREGEDLHFLFGSYPPGGAATAASAFTTAFREHFGESDLEEALGAHLADTPLLVPAFAALLRGSATPKGAEPLTKDSLQTVFVRVTRSLAVESTTVVLVDDLHFAPEEGRSLFAALALATFGHRVLLVGTSQPGLPTGWIADLERLGRAARVPLARLGPRDLASLLVDAFGSQRLATELGFQIGAKSDGNPFFVFEILRELLEGGQLSRRPDGKWIRTSEIRDIRIPSTIVDLIEARIGVLDPADRALLDLAACYGFEFDPLLVGEVVGLGRIPALQRLAGIEKSSRLVRSVGRRYVFDHHQIQEALYAGLSEPLREEYHAAIGDALERRDADALARDGEATVRVCEHFLKGARGARALPYLLPALDHLEKGYVNEAAIGLADRALVEPGLLEGRARLDVLLRRAARLDILGHPGRERQTLEEALAIADAVGAVSARARVRSSLGWNLHRTGRYEEASKVLSDAVALAREAGERKTEGAALGNLGLALSSLGRHDEAREVHERCGALFREIDDRRGEALASGNIGNLLQSLGRYEEAAVHHGRSLEVLRELGDRRSEATATGNVGTAAYAVGRYEQALVNFERQLSLSREIGFRVGEAIALVNLGPLHAALGQAAHGAEQAEAARGLCREIPWPLGEGYAVHALGAVASLAGDLPLARERWTEAVALRRALGNRGALALTLAALGGALVAQGAPDEARAPLAEALVLGRAAEVPGAIVLAGAHAALLPGADAAEARRDLLTYGSRLHAHERLEAAFALWRASPDPEVLAQARRILDDLVANAPKDARAAMLEKVPLHRDVFAAR
jgi:serine/threonine protein kinase/tetratricopeptide (TPR) repeat protein